MVEQVDEELWLVREHEQAAEKSKVVVKHTTKEGCELLHSDQLGSRQAPLL